MVIIPTHRGERKRGSFTRYVLPLVSLVCLPVLLGHVPSARASAPPVSKPINANKGKNWRDQTIRTPKKWFTRRIGSGKGEIGIHIPQEDVESDIPDAPVGIAIGSNGNLYLLDSINRRVQVFSPKGQLLISTGAILENLSFIAISEDGGFFTVSGQMRTTVTRFLKSGKAEWQVDVAGILGGLCSLPGDRVGLLYLEQNSGVTKAGKDSEPTSLPPVLLGPNGKPIEDATLSAALRSPIIAATSRSRLYRLEREYDFVKKQAVTKAHVLISDISEPSSVQTVPIDMTNEGIRRVVNNFRTLLAGGNGAFYLVGGDTENKAFIVVAFDARGKYIDTITIPDDPFGRAGNIAVDDSGRVYSLNYARGNQKGMEYTVTLVSYATKLAKE